MHFFRRQRLEVLGAGLAEKEKEGARKNTRRSVGRSRWEGRFDLTASISELSVLWREGGREGKKKLLALERKRIRPSHAHFRFPLPTPFEFPLLLSICPGPNFVKRSRDFSRPPLIMHDAKRERSFFAPSTSAYLAFPSFTCMQGTSIGRRNRKDFFSSWLAVLLFHFLGGDGQCAGLGRVKRRADAFVRTYVVLH